MNNASLLLAFPCVNFAGGKQWFNASQEFRKENSMASRYVKDLTDASFESEVLYSSVPTLVDFWAVWCGPCKQIAPSIDALADQYQGRLQVAKVDVDKNQIVAQQFGVKSIPTLLIFKSGRVVGQLVGASPRSTIENAILKHL
jgi:thioredoxin 1